LSGELLKIRIMKNNRGVGIIRKTNNVTTGNSTAGVGVGRKNKVEMKNV
jgi:hypothetical protein